MKRSRYSPEQIIYALKQVESGEKAVDLNYRISANDQLTISIFNEEDLSVDRSVQGNGVVTLPLVGPIKVQGKTPAEVEKSIAKAYRDGQILKDPQVSVNISEFAEKSVSIMGQVLKPGKVVIPPGKVRIEFFAAIAGAGDFKGIAKTKAVEIKRKDGKVEKVNVDDIRKGKSKIKTIYLYPGDIVTVPQRFI